MIYTLEIDSSEMEMFLDLFVVGVGGSPDEMGSDTASLVSKVSALGTKYENDRLAGVK